MCFLKKLYSAIYEAVLPKKKKERGIIKEVKKNLNQLKLLMAIFKLAQTLLNIYKASHIPGKWQYLYLFEPQRKLKKSMWINVFKTLTLDWESC